PGAPSFDNVLSFVPWPGTVTTVGRGLAVGRESELVAIEYDFHGDVSLIWPREHKPISLQHIPANRGRHRQAEQHAALVRVTFERVLSSVMTVLPGSDYRRLARPALAEAIFPK